MDERSLQRLIRRLTGKEKIEAAKSLIHLLRSQGEGDARIRMSLTASGLDTTEITHVFSLT